MKIVRTDNFDSDYPDEIEVAVGIKSAKHAEIMCDAMNDAADSKGLDFYKVVDDDYVLRPGFEP